MNGKVLLILCDAVRPDAAELVAHPYYEKVKENGRWTLDASSVLPPVTLPAHISLFQSIDPERHGTKTNVFVPMTEMKQGLCEVLAKNSKACAAFYDWEELRDISSPGALIHSEFRSGPILGYGVADRENAASAVSFMKTRLPDFVFLYLGEPDDAGHRSGWMNGEYLAAVKNCWDIIGDVCSNVPKCYDVIITSDHGGHLNFHGFDCPEDMTIPIMMLGASFEKRGRFHGGSIKDIAPTVAELLGVEAPDHWEGKSLLS